MLLSVPFPLCLYLHQVLEHESRFFSNVIITIYTEITVRYCRYFIAIIDITYKYSLKICTKSSINSF